MTRGRIRPFKVLIVDDNPYVGQSLKSSISWKEMGVEVGAVTSSATEASALVEELHPDILMTDIRMPEMTGIELASLAGSFLPHIQVIIFTGYEDFTYAQKALRVGAVDLILKPLQNADIEAAVRRAVKNLRRIAGGPESTGEVPERLAETLIDARRKFVNDLIFGYTAGESEAQAKAHIVGFLSRRYQLVLGVTPGPLKSASSFYRQISPAPPGEEDGEHAQIVGVIIEGNPVCIIDVKKKTTDVARHQAVLECVGRLRDAADDMRVRVAVSGVHSRLTSMKEAYAEARLMVARFFVDPHSQTAYYSAAEGSAMPKEHAIQTRAEDLSKLLSDPRRGSSLGDDALGDDALGDLVESLFNEAGQQWRSGLPYLERIIMQIYDRFGVRPQRPHAAIWNGAPGLCWGSIVEARDEFLGHIRQSRDRLKTGGDIQDRHMRRMIEYIRHNYAQDIGLKSVAADLQLSASYVSRLARRVTGKTFTELLVEVRIERAKELLLMSDMKVYQVADLVGITNYAYFFQVFRKVTGVSPSDFRTAIEPKMDNNPNKRSPF